MSFMLANQSKLDASLQPDKLAFREMILSLLKTWVKTMSFLLAAQSKRATFSKKDGIYLGFYFVIPKLLYFS